MKLYLPKLGHIQVRFIHDPRHGTTATALPPLGPPLGVGEARLCRGDHFCRAVGRRVSLRRLLAELPISRVERGEVWRTYFGCHRDLT